MSKMRIGGGIFPRNVNIPHDQFPPGLWSWEPDSWRWVDRETGYDCAMIRNRNGAWCGYVRVGERHPFFRAHYDAASVENDIDVHGGLTFAGRVDDQEWWFGFDCAHFDDYVPMLHRNFAAEGWYKDFLWVQREVTRLAQQLWGAR